MQERLSILGVNQYRNDIWEYFQVPMGVSRSTAIDSILMECAELGLVYTDPDVLKQQIALWSAKELPGWTRMQLAFSETYNPLHNFDRYEEWTDTGAASATGQNTNKVAGFNQSAGLASRDQSDQSTSSNSSGSHKGHLYGNIGVTTSAQMLEGELEIRQQNMIDIIVRSFKNNLCVQVY